MDYVNLQVAIGGDAGNTVPKFYVPVSEIPVLMALHGPDSLTEFEQVEPHEGIEELSNGEELQRLHSLYGHVTDGNGDSVLRQVYPGAGAKVLESIDDIEIPEGAYKVTERATSKKAAAKKPASKKDAAGDVLG